MANQYSSLKSAPFLLILFAIARSFFAAPVHALDLGLRATQGLNLFKACSTTCESKFCDTAPLLRYGKYCGLLYSGCPGEKPCDQLDVCCMRHDLCIATKGNSYLSEQCNSVLKDCVDKFRKFGAPTFKGNTCKVDDVVNVINHVMDAAIAAGKVFGKP